MKLRVGGRWTWLPPVVAACLTIAITGIFAGCTAEVPPSTGGPAEGAGNIIDDHDAERDVPTPAPPADSNEASPADDAEAWFTVNFSHPNGTIDVQVDPGREKLANNTDENGGNRQYSEGSWLKLRAIPNPGYKLTGWEGELVGPQPNKQFRVTADTSVTAVFAEARTLTTTVSDPSAGTVYTSPGGEREHPGAGVTREVFLKGTELMVAAIPDEDQPIAFSHWVAPGVFDAAGQRVDGSSAVRLDLVLDGDIALEAVFVPGHRLTLNITQRGGEIRIDPGGKTYYEDSTVIAFPESVKSVQVTPIPDELHYFSGWREFDDPDPKTAPLTIPLDRDQVATAVFPKQWEGDGTKYFLRLLPSLDGIFFLESSKEYVSELTLREFEPGEKVRVLPAPAKGWRLKMWLGDFHGSAPALDMVMNRDYDIMAEFARIEGVEGDSDGDGLPDEWESRHFKSLNGDGDSDGDGDELLDFYEYHYGTDPKKKDSDADGLPDRWESDHGLNPADSEGLHGAQGDPDRDSKTNEEEFKAGTHPAQLAAPKGGTRAGD